ncbi:MAG TPA: DUF998 domain-containing protein [Candidatus Acidoferrales bacterium]|nr:DUF998 domain-containing protein [Candidatus Acidoferrales bacterium]
MKNEFPLAARNWAMISIVGTIIYVVLDIVVQLLPPYYSAFREAESLLAIGPYGCIMNINFFVRGILSFSVIMAIRSSVKGLSRRIRGTIFFGIWSVGSFLLGVFNTDTMGMPHLTFHGTMHILLALVAFICAPVGEILLSVSLGRVRAGRSALWLGILSVVLLLVQFACFRSGYYGLFERLFIGLVVLWVAAVSFKLMRLKNRFQEEANRAG